MVSCVSAPKVPLQILGIHLHGWWLVESRRSSMVASDSVPVWRIVKLLGRGQPFWCVSRSWLLFLFFDVYVLCLYWLSCNCTNGRFDLIVPETWDYGDWPSSGEIGVMETVGHAANNFFGKVHSEAYNYCDGTEKGGFSIKSKSDWHGIGCDHTWTPAFHESPSV